MDKAIEELLAKVDKQPVRLAQALLIGTKSHTQLMEISEVSGLLYLPGDTPPPIGGILVFVDELMPPNKAVVLYERPQSLQDARRIYLREINKALGLEKESWWEKKESWDALFKPHK